MSGFIGDPGKDFSGGDTPAIAKRLDQLAKHLGITIYGISGVRTPAQSAALGYPNGDRHTKGKAIDVGVNGQLRASAAQLSDSELAAVGLYRPYPGAAEINHIELDPNSPWNNPSNPGVGGAVVGALNDAPGAATDAVAGAAASAGAGLAADVGKSLWGSLVDALSANGGRVSLSIGLVIAGLALLGLGAARAFGLHKTSPGKDSA